MIRRCKTNRFSRAFWHQFGDYAAILRLSNIVVLLARGLVVCETFLMCLYCTIRLPKQDFPLVNELAVSSGSGQIGVGWQSGFLSRDRSTLYISEQGQGCACSMLSEKWNDETNEFRPEILPDLAQVVQNIRQQTSSGFKFTAGWNKSNEERQVSLKEMVQLILQNKVGLRTSYIVE